MKDKYNTRQKGKYTEEIAKKFLLQKGYHIISRNFYSQFGEIDLIISNNNLIDKITNFSSLKKVSSNISSSYPELVFCEIKYRSSNAYGGAVSSVNYHKQQKIIKTAKRFISMYNLHNYYFRFDVLCICKTGPKIKVDWFKGAFY